MPAPELLPPSYPPGPAPAPQLPAPGAWSPPLVSPAVTSPAAAPAAPVPAPGKPPTLPPPPPPAVPPAAPAAFANPAPLQTESAGLATGLARDEDHSRAVPDDRARGLFTSTLLGSVGLLRTSAAHVAPAGSWRLALRGEYASSTGFLVVSDRNRRVAGDLALSVSPLPNWEIFGAILASTNHNERCASGDPSCSEEPDRADPAFIRSFGDAILGSKVVGQVSPRFSLGMELGARLYASNASLGFETGATSAFVTALATVDLRQRAALPVVLHGNFGYVDDRSRELADFDQLSRGMINSRAVAAFAYGVALPRLRGSLGVVAPLQSRDGPAINPYVEYQVERITADPDAAFAEFASPLCGDGAGQKACSEQKVQQRLGFGLRAQFASGLGFDLGLELATGSVGLAYGPPLPIWNLVFGVGYSSQQPRPQIRTITVERQVDRPVPPALGFVGGRVLDSRNGMPIAGAIIDVVGVTRVRVATDSDGAFVSKGARPGVIDLEFSAPGFGTQALRTQVVVGQTTPVEVTLLPLPPQPPPLPLSEPVPAPPPATAAPGATKLENPAVLLEAGRLVWRRPIRFAGAASAPSAQLTPESLQLLDQFAVILGQHPEIDRIRIEAHWDSGIDRQAAQTLTQDQANAVAQHLMERGFPPERLEAVGFGSTRPKVPNLGPQSRARNRRLDITIPGGPARSAVQ